MGFLLYRTTGGRHAMSYTLVRKLVIVGKNGPLSTWLASKSGEAAPFSWKLAGADLVAALAPDVDPAGHAIVMDMMPERLAGASLCHVTSLAGQSEYDETTMAIALRELYMATIATDGTDPRLSFVCNLDTERPDLIETMGITGGTRRGTYRWCAPKMNIGAAIFHAAGAKS